MPCPARRGDPSRRSPGSANARRRRAPGRRATAAVRCRIVCPRLPPQGYCGIVQMGPQADAPCLGRGHLLPVNALTEMCGVTKRHEGAGRPAVDGASLTARRTSETTPGISTPESACRTLPPAAPSTRCSTACPAWPNRQAGWRFGSPHQRLSDRGPDALAVGSRTSKRQPSVVLTTLTCPWCGSATTLTSVSRATTGN